MVGEAKFALVELLVLLQFLGGCRLDQACVPALLVAAIREVLIYLMGFGTAESCFATGRCKCL